MNDENLLKPSPNCLFCGKTLSEIGGKRIVVKKTRAVFISDKKIDGGNNGCPIKCFNLSNQEQGFLVLRMPRSAFVEEVIERAKSQVSSGFHPWFCQICGNNICRECGSPTQLVMGADAIDSDGKIGHQAILPIKPGCVNEKCKNHFVPE